MKKILIIAILVIVVLIGWIIWYEHTYPCLYGHYEEQWQMNWCYQANGTMTPCGGYFINIFICDCRDSLK